MPATTCEPNQTLTEQASSDTESVRRTAFYLESQGQPLFAWLHHRVEQTGFDHGVLICPPIGYEQLHSHRSLRHLADRLAQEEVPVLRFDWHGTGDSAGVDEDAGRVAAWLANIRDAVQWMRERLGCRQISLVGLRLGGTLAALVAAELEIDNLVLWSPVTKGRAYVREMKAISLTAETAPRTADADGCIEAAGFVLSAETAGDLSQLDLLTSFAIQNETSERGGVSPLALPRRADAALPRRADAQEPGGLRRPAQKEFTIGRVLLVSRDDLPDDVRLSDHLSASGLSVETLRVPGFVEMMQEPHRSQVPEAAIREITSWLTRHISAEAASTAMIDIRRTTPTSAPISPASGSIHNEIRQYLRESAVRFSEQPDLFGIVCEPAVATSNDLPLVVLLNAGSSYRIGPGRLYVFLARQLAAQGFRTVRLDFCSLGDSVSSDSEYENDPHPATAFRDVDLILKQLQQRYGATKIVLMGLCSGAYAAFQSAAQLQNPVLVESILINPLTFFWKEGMSLDVSPVKQLVSIHYYIESALQPAKWLRLLRGQTKIGFVGAVKIVLRKLGVLRLAKPAARSEANPCSSHCQKTISRNALVSGFSAKPCASAQRLMSFSTMPNRLLKNVGWTLRPSENQLESDGRGVHPTVFQQAVSVVDPSQTASPSHPQEEDVPGDLDRIARSGRTLSLFFATTDPGFSILTHYAKRKVKQLRRTGQLNVSFIPDADHTFTMRAARQALSREISDHLNRRYSSRNQDGVV